MTDLSAPLIATADEQLLDDGLRWCAAMGVVPDLAVDVTAVRRGWRRASVVIIGSDLAGDLAKAALPRREHVLIVAREPDEWWPVAVTLGATAVCAPHEDDRIIDVLAGALDGRDEGCVVAVVGGCGGAGASTLAVALGLAAHERRLRPLVVDADPLGGGLDLVMGAERSDGLRWHDFEATRGRVEAGSLADVLPQRRGVSSLTWGSGARVLPESLSAVLDAAVRGFDLVAVDVPRELGTTGVEIIGRSVLTLLLVPEEIASVAASRHVLAELRQCAPAMGLVSVGRRGGIGSEAVAEALELPVLARLRPDRALPGAIDRGQGPGRSRRLRRTAGTILDALGLEQP